MLRWLRLFTRLAMTAVVLALTAHAASVGFAGSGHAAGHLPSSNGVTADSTRTFALTGWTSAVGQTDAATTHPQQDGSPGSLAETQLDAVAADLPASPLAPAVVALPAPPAPMPGDDAHRGGLGQRAPPVR